MAGGGFPNRLLQKKLCPNGEIPRTTIVKTVALLLALAGMSFAEETSRTWTNSEGKTVTGILKSKSSTTAEVLLSGGKSATLEIAKLSKADQDYIAAAQVFPQLKMVARTAKAKSNEAGSQMDNRAVEVELSNVSGRNLMITLKWLGPEGSTVGVYKTQTKYSSVDGIVSFDVVYRGSGVGSDYKGYAVVVEYAGQILAKSASQKPFERFLELPKE